MPRQRNYRPLSGLRVVEVASYLTGPFTGMTLAHLGAEVTKVEPPGGDPFNSVGLRHDGLGALFANVNHGKHRLAVDLKASAGVAALHRLVADADVVIENWRPGVAEKLGLGYDELRAGNPGLIYLAITGYGDTGPRIAEPVFDALVQGQSGLTQYEFGSEANLVRSWVVDKVTAMIAVQAVLAAVFDRTRTGKGSRLDVPMLDAMAYFNFPDVAHDRTFVDRERVDLARPLPCVVDTLDGRIAVNPVSGRQMAAAVAAVGHPEWKEQLKATSSPTDLMNRFVSLLQSATRVEATDALEARFRDADVPAARVLSLDEHFEDEQVVHNELYEQVAVGSRAVRRVRHPVRADGALTAQIAPVEQAPAPGPS